MKHIPPAAAVTEDTANCPFFEAHWAELQKLPAPAELSDWFKPHNLAHDALGAYCAGGEL